MKNSFKELAVLRTDGPESAKLPPLTLDRLAYSVEQFIRWGWFPYDRKRLQIALIRGARDFDAPADIGNAFSQGQPFQRASARYGRAHAKPLRFINRGFDAQHAALFVVHLNRVFFHPVFDSYSFKTALQIGFDLTAANAAVFASEKAQHVRGMKVSNRVVDQGGINGSQCLVVAKQNIGRVFSLTHGPVVGSQDNLATLMEPGVDTPRQGIKERLPFPLYQTIAELLSPAPVTNLRETIVSLRITNPALLHLPCQVLPAVDTNLNRQRQPGLQAHVQQAKLAIHKIEVEMQTLPFFGSQLQLFAGPVAAHRKRTARLNARQHADQAFRNPVALHNRSRLVFFRCFGRRQMDQGSTTGSRQLFRVSFHLCRNLLDEHPKVLIKNSLARQKSIKAAQVTNRTQVSPKKHAVETCYTSDDAVTMPLRKTLHDAPPIELSQTQLSGSASWGASIFGCG